MGVIEQKSKMLHKIHELLKSKRIAKVVKTSAIPLEESFFLRISYSTLINLIIDDFKEASSILVK